VSGYAAFARFYDAVQGDRGSDAEYARSLLERHQPKAHSVLELACGTGSVLTRLRGDYEAAGVDLSPEMLAVARRKLPGVDLVQGDMTAVRLGRCFDAVLCLYDSVNHLPRKRDWERFFDTARAHLEPAGVVVFDVNTEARLARLAAAPPLVQRFDGNLLLVDVVAGGRGRFDSHLRVFERTGGTRYRLHESIVPERSFPLEWIRVALDRRFRRVRVIDRLRSRPNRHSGRLWFVCEGPLTAGRSRPSRAL
jgi:SAM-dependent methyltransferase